LDSGRLRLRDWEGKKEKGPNGERKEVGDTLESIGFKEERARSRRANYSGKGELLSKKGRPEMLERTQGGGRAPMI